VFIYNAASKEQGKKGKSQLACEGRKAREARLGARGAYYVTRF
jgi:hypothetical protein